MLTWMKLIIWAGSSCSEAGDKVLTCFYDYFALEYREGIRERRGGLLPGPAALFGNIRPGDVQGCSKVLKNAFAGYRGGRNTEELKMLLNGYRGYVAGLHSGHAKDRYNAFVYRYMVEIHVGNRAIAAKLGVSDDTVLNYVNRCIDEMLVLCMGMPAAGVPGDGVTAVRMMIEGSRLISGMAGDCILCLFPGKKERAAVERGRHLTVDIMGRFGDAVEAYAGYCNDGHTRVDTDIRRSGVLEKCLAGVTPAAIAEEYGCSESTVYADIRENERRLAAMLFDEGESVSVTNERNGFHTSVWKEEH